MTRTSQAYQGWYIASLLLGSVAAASLSALLWQSNWGLSYGTGMLINALLVALALCFPLKVSPQASASLAAIPLFAGILLLSPIQAAIASAAGSVIANAWLRRRPLVATFNVAVVALAVALASIVYRSISPEAALLLGSPLSLVFVLLAGAVLHIVNLAAMLGMISLQKGLSFWSAWKKAWVQETIQEAGGLALGYLGAALIQEAWWSILLLAVPLTLVYIALSRSTQETLKNIKLSQALKAQMEEQKAMQSQLVQSAKMASVGTLAAGVAHEINNPLFAILGRAELLLRRPDQHLASPRAKEYLKDIHDMAQRASQTVKELLGYSRPGNAAEPVKLTEAIDVSLRLIGKMATNSNIQILKEYSDVPPIEGVPSHLQQVFVNLLQNACESTPSGGTIHLKCWAEDGKVKTSVKDTGHGIPQEILPHLFEPFVTTKEVGKGTGLGLFICHRIVTEHRGSIQIKSEEGTGTEVLLEFPVPKTSATTPNTSVH